MYVASRTMPSGPRPAPPGSSVRVALSGSVFATYWANVFWLQLTESGTVDVSDLHTLADAIAAAFHTQVLGALTSNIYLTQVKLTHWDGSGNEIQYVGTYSFQGGGTSQQHNAAVAIVVDWFISAHYRGGHPRSYWPGPADDQINNGATLSSSYRTTLATCAANFLSAVNALTASHVTGVAMGTVSFVHAGAWRTPPVFRAYIGSAIRQVLGIQKRRLQSTTP